MRRRVAVSATAAIFAILIAFLVRIVYVAHQADVLTETERISSLCRMSSETLDIAALAYIEPEETYARLRNIAADQNIGITVADEEGVVLFSVRTSGVAVGSSIAQDSEIVMAQSGQMGQARRTLYTGDALFVAQQISDGRIVRLTGSVPSLWRAISYEMPSLVITAALAALVFYAIFWWMTARMSLTVMRASQLLEAFAEGRFEERILGIPGKSKRDVAQINAAADRIEEQLVRQRRRNQALSAVMNQMQNGILAVDDQLRVILVTPMAKQLLGISGGAEGVSIMDASKDVRLEQVLQDAMQQKGIYTNEVVARTGTGRSHRPLRLYVSAMWQDDAAIGALALVEDITELKRLEQVRNDFVANVSHELKTPLTSIRGFVETLQAGAINNPEMADKFLRIIMLEAERLTRLINDILTITKLESGVETVSNSRIRLDQKAYDVADMLRIHAGEKQITIHAHQSDEAIYIWGNPDRVEQMLINLIENGIKYNQPGGSVSVSVFASQDTVNLLISDTGIGISEEHIARLFERFYRVDKGRSRNMGGTGLGLAIVKHIIRGMNGLIEVHSKLNEGTEFLVTLPRYLGEPGGGVTSAENGDESDGEAWGDDFS